MNIINSKVVNAYIHDDGDLKIKFDNGVVLECQDDYYTLLHENEFDFENLHGLKLKGVLSENSDYSIFIELENLNEELYLTLSLEDLSECTLLVNIETERFIEFSVQVPIPVYRAKLTDAIESMDNMTDDEIILYQQTTYPFYELDLVKQRPNSIFKFLCKLTGNEDN